MKRYKSDIIFFVIIAAFLIASYFLASVVLPFIVALGMAFAVNPVIVRIQRFIPNRNLATTILLLSILAVFSITIWLFAAQISNDFKRLNSAFHTYAESNHEMLDKTTQSIKSFIDKVYSPEKLKEKLGIDSTASDSISFNQLINKVDKDKIINELDTDAIQKSLKSLTSVFSSNNNSPEQKTDSPFSFNWFIVFISSLGYFLYIIYTFEYFQRVFRKYFSKGKGGTIHKISQEVRRTFLSYFKQRTKIVLIYMAIYIIAFLIIGLPGAIILGIIAGLLCYISYFQYITLIPIALGCIILSIEHEQSFFLYFGIVFGVFVLTSLLEELYLYDKIMKDVKGMNPAVMMISIAVWGYLLGTFGVLIALPLTSVIISYSKLVILNTDNKRITTD